MSRFINWLSSFHGRLPKLLDFFRWMIVDIYRYFKGGRKFFREYGVTMYTGRQGGGKTMGMVEYLERMRKKYPNLQIYTNFSYKHETAPMEGWRDVLEKRNGTDGVIFAIDEIQNEYSSTAWKDLPETLLQEITQQRKQRIKIVCTSQVFGRVAKPLREQCYEVVECRTLLGRWTFLRAFDAYEYSSVYENPERKLKLHRIWRLSFIQSDHLRDCFDSYARVERMKRTEYLARNERGA